MKKEMLWYDNSRATLDEKIREAARYYRRTYGQDAEVCLINASDQFANPELTCVEVDGQMVAVRPWQDAAPGHMCVGIEDASP